MSRTEIKKTDNPGLFHSHTCRPVRGLYSMQASTRRQWWFLRINVGVLSNPCRWGLSQRHRSSRCAIGASIKRKSCYARLTLYIILSEPTHSTSFSISLSTFLTLLYEGKALETSPASHELSPSKWRNGLNGGTIRAGAVPSFTYMGSNPAPHDCV